ncbi:MAG: phage baseplate assembly protein V [Lachnospiraceae bacterium]|nr:phage baseplate assembly protein V [Lachnospiraceae bacterium]
MAILEIFNEVTEKNIVKSETGDPRIFGVMVGEVTDNYSMEMPGRVCVSIHVRDMDRNVLKWARVAQPSSGEEWGHYFLPEVGDQVLVTFDQGIIDEPYIIGCIPKDMNKFLRDSKHQKNIYKVIQTRHGSTIKFTDGRKIPVEGEQEEGANDKIEIYTPDRAHEVSLDNENHKITIKDKDGNASIEMSTLNGNIDINAMSKITITVGENISIALNGTTGKISVSANDIAMESVGRALLKGGGKAELTGATVNIDSQGLLKLNAEGLTTISGTPIKLG